MKDCYSLDGLKEQQKGICNLLCRQEECFQKKILKSISACKYIYYIQMYVLI